MAFVGGTLPCIFSDIFTYNRYVHDHHTRSSYKFHPPCVKTERSKKSIRYHGAVLWNDLCDHIEESTSPHSIKSNIKKYLLSCQ